MPMLWIGPSTETFYKTFKGANCSIKETKYENNHLSRRHASDGCLSTGIDVREGYFDFCITASRPCNKLKKVSLDSNQKTRIYGCSHRFEQDGYLPSRGETCKDPKPVSNSLISENCFSKGTHSAHRETVFDGYSSPSSSASVPISSKRSDCKLAQFWLIRKENSSFKGSEIRVDMVEKQPCPQQWEIPYMETSPINNSIRWHQRRVGGILSRAENRGTLDIGGERTPYKHPRIESSKISHFNLYQKQRLSVFGIG